MFEEIIVAVPRLGGRGVIDSSELVKDSSRRLGAIVEEEQDPEVDRKTALGSQNDSSFVIGVIVDEVAHCGKNLGSLVLADDIVATPDLVVLRVSLHSIRSDDSEVIASAPQAHKEIYRALVYVSMAAPGSLTWVFGLSSVDNSAIGQDNFKVHHVVCSPAVLGAQEAHAAWE